LIKGSWPYLIPPGAKVRLLDDRIDMEQYQCGQLSCTINMDIKYGSAVGKEKYTIHVEGRVTITMDQYGLVTVINLDPTHKVE
jgi:hypothetical protein